jgi:hypothetical protein
MAEQEQAEGDEASVGWLFWVGAAVVGLVSMPVGFFGIGFLAVGLFWATDAACEVFDLRCSWLWPDAWGRYSWLMWDVIGAVIGLLVGPVVGILLVRRMYRKRKALLAAEQERDAE